MNPNTSIDRINPTAPCAVRFWIHYGQHPVKLTLRAGQPVNLHRSERHDEGASYRGDTFTVHEGCISWHAYRSCIDCDGRVDHHDVLEASIESMRTRDLTAGETPDWTVCRARVYDYNAEKANY